jgi:hypothetical protein
METTTDLNIARIEDLGYELEAGGIDADPVNLLLLAHTARDLGVNEMLVSLMIDEEEPRVARMRAFARVSVQVSMRLFDGPARIAVATSELQHAC